MATEQFAFSDWTAASTRPPRRRRISQRRSRFTLSKAPVSMGNPHAVVFVEVRGVAEGSAADDY
jgi:diaminopimelate epimerase